eukprot:7384633-Prymnesium_polylepis.2
MGCSATLRMCAAESRHVVVLRGAGIGEGRSASTRTSGHCGRATCRTLGLRTRWPSGCALPQRTAGQTLCGHSVFGWGGVLAPARVRRMHGAVARRRDSGADRERQDQARGFCCQVISRVSAYAHQRGGALATRLAHCPRQGGLPSSQARTLGPVHHLVFERTSARHVNRTGGPGISRGNAARVDLETPQRRSAPSRAHRHPGPAVEWYAYVRCTAVTVPPSLWEVTSMPAARARDAARRIQLRCRSSCLHSTDRTKAYTGLYCT